MNRGTIAIRNSTVSLLTQILTIVLQFATRSVFIRYLGVELLGLSSTFASLLSTLSLAELGFQSAVVFNLYALWRPTMRMQSAKSSASTG